MLEEKIRIAALLEALFQRPASARQLSFNEVASVVQVPENQVELLLMRAMSLGLMRGVIDGVTQTIDVSWIRPRVLQPIQLKV